MSMSCEAEGGAACGACQLDNLNMVLVPDTNTLVTGRFELRVISYTVRFVKSSSFCGNTRIDRGS